MLWQLLYNKLPNELTSRSCIFIALHIYHKAQPRGGGESQAKN